MATEIPVERQISQTVKCLVVEGKLSGYENELQLIVTAILEKKCGINCTWQLATSELSQTPHNPNNRRLMHVGLSNRKQPVDIIWSILHEYGHLLQGSEGLKDVLIDNSLEYPREKDAWDKAEIEVLKYPRLVALMADFYVYRDNLLSSYIR